MARRAVPHTAAHSVFFIIDDDNTVVKTDQGLIGTFGLDYYQMVGDNIENHLPELEPILQHVRTRGNVDMEEVQLTSLKNGPRVCLVSTTSIHTDMSRYTAVTLQNKSYLSGHMHRMLNQGAYFTLDHLIGQTPAFLRLKKQIIRSADSPGNVLIVGESGTGKELIAQSIHNTSYRKNNPFISLNCASIPKELISSELFGYESGAFTGARKGGSPGKFELANGGTLFLDEIGDMPLNMQAVLLRVLEERSITRLGGAKSRPVDVRIIAATNRNLLEDIKSNAFRPDLFYRLNVIRLDAVPLRQRLDDLPLLVEHFLSDLSVIYDKPGLRVSDEVLAQFRNYSWPGNVRELRNLLERLTNMIDGTVIELEHLQPDCLPPHPSGQRIEPAKNSRSSDSDRYEDYERKQIQRLLRENRGNKTAVAKALGIARQTLYAKLDRYGLR